MPEEVETLVSLPLESALNGTPGVTLVRSVSQTGISFILVVFQYGTDIYKCRQLVNERIQMAMQRLPKAAGAPMMLPVMSVIGDIFKIGLISDKTSLMDLRTLADWDIRNRILAVPGVSRVLIFGGEQKQFIVNVSPQKLKSFGLTLAEVRNAVSQANVVASGGFLTTSEQQFTIRAMGRVHNISELSNSVVATRDGVPILLKHVARVEIGHAFQFGDSIVNGHPGVEIVITKQPGVNTLEITKDVQAALNEVQHELPPDVKMITVFRQADFIEKSIGNVLFAIGMGGLFVVLVLLMFLFNWRTSVISLTAIPVSLITAILVIRATGGSINTMSLGGLAIAVGEVVDDAIVDVENVYKRLRENKRSPHPKGALTVIRGRLSGGSFVGLLRDLYRGPGVRASLHLIGNRRAHLRATRSVVHTRHTLQPSRGAYADTGYVYVVSGQGGTHPSGRTASRSTHAHGLFPPFGRGASGAENSRGRCNPAVCPHGQLDSLHGTIIFA